MAEEQFILGNNPDWDAAAHDLISGLTVRSAGEDRVQLLESVCLQLGDQLYPAFLQILHFLQSNTDKPSHVIMATTLVDCLQSGRLPSGKLAAWGSSTYSGDRAFGQSRRLGPIEFVCAWYAQPSSEAPLSLQQFSIVLNSLLALVSSSTTARQLYCLKLAADADDPLGGSLSSQTRAGLRSISQSWQHSEPDESHQPVVDAFLSALQAESLLNQISKRPF